MKEYDDLALLVSTMAADVTKFEGGNKSAGTRVRKQCQECKKLSQAIRLAIIPKDEPATAKSAKAKKQKPMA